MVVYLFVFVCYVLVACGCEGVCYIAVFVCLRFVGSVLVLFMGLEICRFVALRLVYLFVCGLSYCASKLLIHTILTYLLAFSLSAHTRKW